MRLMWVPSLADLRVWSLAFGLQPVSAVFYPVSVLPGWLQGVAFFVPASHVFESLRSFFAEGQILVGRLVWAGTLDVVYLAGAAAVAARMYRQGRVLGKLARPGY